MAGSSALPPVRSISLPSRLHPTPQRIEEELKKLRRWKASPISEKEPLRAENIQFGLVGLAKLYNCIEELILSPPTHHALLCHEDGEIVEKALDESVTLLDVCSTAKDILSMITENVQVLQSALRRKGTTESSIQTYLVAYVSFKKKVSKDISKCINALKQTGKWMGSSSDILLQQNQHLSVAAKVLREVSSITISVLQSVMLFLSSPVMKTRLNGCSLISKIVPLRFLSNSEKRKKIANEVGSVDVALYGLYQQSKSSSLKFEVSEVQRKLESLAVCVDGLKGGVGCVYRGLIQYRVSLLNVLTH